MKSISTWAYCNGTLANNRTAPSLEAEGCLWVWWWVKRSITEFCIRSQNATTQQLNVLYNDSVALL